MSLADLAARTTPINDAVTSRILILDVERVPGLTVQRWWDRGSLQSRYIHHESVTREPRTTIVCAKWYDSPDVIELAEWDKGGRGNFLKRVHRLMSQADIIVGHNVDRADIPWLKGDFCLPRIGHKHVPNLPPLPPFKTVDTLKVLRRELGSGAPFKGLDAACQIIGLPSKTDRYDADAMERALAGSTEDRERLVSYCSGDVLATQWLYDWCRPHIKNHPVLKVMGADNRHTCHRCGNEAKPIERRYVATLLSYTMLRCVSCKAYSRISVQPERMAYSRGV